MNQAAAKLCPHVVLLINLHIGQRVTLPSGRIARVESREYQRGNDPFERVDLRYLDPALGTVSLQRKDLKDYTGPPVVFRDEVAMMRMRHGDVPLGKSALILPVDD